MDRPKIKCVFFDRDGIVNVSPPEGDYVRSWADFRLSPDLPDILRIVRDKGCAAVVVTNQRGVAKGLMSEAAVEDIHARLQEPVSYTHLTLPTIYSV